MIRRMNDARMALGWGLTFVGYALWLTYDYYRTSKRAREETIARLTANNAASKADEYKRAEFEA